MSDHSKIWVSELNARPEIRSAFPHSTVHFYDTTLRDGEQTVGVILSPQQKLEIARKLDELGVSRIEAGFPRVSPEDAEAIQLMSKAGLKAELWGFSRAVKADVEELVRLGLQASVIESPTSDIKLKAYGISRDEVLRRVVDAVSFASKAGINVAYFAVDGTRTDLEFLKRVYLTALEAGAKEIVVVDTIGACGPEAAEFLVGQVREWVGADVALALQCLYDVPVALNFTKVREASEAVCKQAGYTLEAWKPLVGENLFMRESGAVASQFHIPEAIEPYSSELVNAKRSIVLGKKSGLDSIDLKCKELGITITPEQRAPILAAVKKRAIAKHGLVSDQEFREIVRESAVAQPA
jgi:isopropylmalate/homocitrate/citramalate synthase